MLFCQNQVGEKSILALAAHSPSHILFTGRSTTRADSLLNTLNSQFPTTAFTFIPLDLASLASIQAGSRQLLTMIAKLDILICNAGIMAVPPGLTEDGYEIQFGTNFLGHALLVKLLLPLLLSTAKQPDADVRVVFLTSAGYAGHPIGGILFPSLKTPQSKIGILGPWQRYGQTKLALILYARELARRYGEQGLLAISVHPGVYKTGLVTGLGWGQRAFVTVANVWRFGEEGDMASNSCWAATGKREGVENGGFYLPVGVRGKKVRENENMVLAGSLWEYTEKELEGFN
jgi:NAD(P)-dependent dehydrogenase (short-subunit alcohol dehydrogenase family)